ncbi:restriction endonuclease subunit S [Gilvibacter sp.]|jgi:type I restriction enzyme S subunit|uniref:restriction endonuclease subunit S n=1 Tax=Gilvibacter sp. TaxID=2729997 RepID=UPI003B52FEEE
MTESWQIKKLKDIGVVQTGTTPSTRDKDNYGDYIPFIKPAHFKPNGEIESGDSMLSEKGLNSGRHFEANSVLMVCIGATIGKTGFSTVDFSSNQQINILTPSEDCDYKYLYYAMISPSFQDKVLKSGKSSQATLPIINKSKWQNLELPIPPLSEQKLIVEVLDQTFEAIDQAKTNIERNIENASELFKSKLHEIFGQRGEGWEEQTLGEMGTLTSSKRIFKKEYVQEGIPFYRSKEVKELAHDKEISLELFITRNRYDEIKSKYGVPKEGDILLTAVGTIGEMYVVKKNDQEFYFKDGNIMWLKDFTGLNTYYLKYALMSFVEQLKSMSQGSAYKALTIEKLKKYKISVPDIISQNQIVEQIESLQLYQRRIIRIYEQKLVSINDLKKSILQKAFAGELIGKEVEV